MERGSSPTGPLKKLSLPLPSVPGAVEQVEIAILPQHGIVCLHHTAPAQLALGPCHAMGRAKPSKTAASRATLRAAWQRFLDLQSQEWVDVGGMKASGT